MMLLVPCPVCGTNVPVELVNDGDNHRAPDLLPNMNNHIITVHEMGVSGT